MESFLVKNENIIITTTRMHVSIHLAAAQRSSATGKAAAQVPTRSIFSSGFFGKTVLEICCAQLYPGSIFLDKFEKLSDCARRSFPFRCFHSVSHNLPQTLMLFFRFQILDFHIFFLKSSHRKQGKGGNVFVSR